MNNKYHVEISVGIIFKTILILLALWFVYFIFDIIALFFLAVIIVAFVEPIVNMLERKKVSRTVGVLLVYCVMFLIIGGFISFLIPPISEQIKEFSKNFPTYSKNIISFFQGISGYFNDKNITIDAQKLIGDLSGELANLSGGIFTTTIEIFSFLISTIVVLTLAFYMTAKEEGINHFVAFFTPKEHREYALNIADRIKEKIGKWMNGQLLLMFIVFILDFIGLSLIGVPYALILAVLGGIFEIIPFIGPIVSAIPGVLLGFTISPLAGILTLVMYFVVQQVESNVILPQVMKRAIGLNPIVAILVLLVGAKLGGMMGVILAVPLATAFSVFTDDFFKSEK